MSEIKNGRLDLYSQV